MVQDVVFTENLDYIVLLDEMRKKFFKRYRLSKKSDSSGLTKYKILRMIGYGSYGKVFLVQQYNKYYAAKQISKQQIFERNKLQYVTSEKNILNAVRFPNMVWLIDSHKDNDNLYIVLPFIAGGDLFGYLSKKEKFNEKQACFYAAQVLLAFEYLHHCGILYRDLKPENILIDVNGYLRLTDFGFAKYCEKRTMTLCGTPDYMAPEIIETKPYGVCVDWWAFGVLCYELVTGVSPFATSNNNLIVMYRNICDGIYKMPKIFSQELKDLVRNLLQVDITKRYGSLANGTNDIKNHVWFQYIDWIRLLNQNIKASHTPKIRSESDLSNFAEVPKFLSAQSKSNTNLYEKYFANF